MRPGFLVSFASMRIALLGAPRHRVHALPRSLLPTSALALLHCLVVANVAVSAGSFNYQRLLLAMDAKKADVGEQAMLAHFQVRPPPLLNCWITRLNFNLLLDLFIAGS